MYMYMYICTYTPIKPPKESLINPPYVVRNNEQEIRETMGKSMKLSALKAID